MKQSVINFYKLNIVSTTRCDHISGTQKRKILTEVQTSVHYYILRICYLLLMWFLSLFAKYFCKQGCVTFRLAKGTFTLQAERSVAWANSISDVFACKATSECFAKWKLVFKLVFAHRKWSLLQKCICFLPCDARARSAYGQSRYLITRPRISRK